MPTLAGTGQRSIREYLTSETFALEPIDSETSFNIHESLLRSISPVLSAACNNEWKEGTLRHYKFREEVTEQVLLCFLTWAYHGDYHSTNRDDMMPSSVSAEANTNGLEHVFRSKTIKRSKKDKKKQGPAAVLGSTSRLPHVEEPPADELPADDEEGAGEKAYESLTVTMATAKDNTVHPLLLHAMVYVFAHLYLIKPLKAIAKQKMIEQLRKLENLFEGNERAAVFDVLAYTFSRLPEEDPLLHWLAHYASWRLDELRQMPTEFDDLISDEDGNFAKILLKYVFKSTINPFNLNDEQAMPRYPMLTANTRYDVW